MVKQWQNSVHKYRWSPTCLFLLTAIIQIKQKNDSWSKIQSFIHSLTWFFFSSCLLFTRLSPVLLLRSQIQPLLWAKDVEPYAAPCWRLLLRRGQQPEEEGAPAPEFQPRLWPESSSPQTQRCPGQGASPAGRAQPGGSGDGKRAGLRFPQGNRSPLTCPKASSPRHISETWNQVSVE